MEEEGMDEQSRFRAKRGTIDRSTETWVLFVNLAKVNCASIGAIYSAMTLRTTKPFCEHQNSNSQERKHRKIKQYKERIRIANSSSFNL
jgi:hypothetical protein